MNNIEPLINMMKIKFSELRELFAQYDIKHKKINLYIDLDDLIINKLLSEVNRAVLLSLKGVDKSVISLSSEIINVAAHYRSFLSRNKIKSSIIFFNVNSNSRCYKKYLDIRDEEHPVTGEANIIINSNLKLMSTVMPYIPKVYYVPIDKVAPTRVIQWITKSVTQDELNIILTNDKIYHSLVSKNVVVLRRIYGHKPSLITRKNVFDKHLSKIKYKPNNILNEEFSKLFTACKTTKLIDLDKVKGCSFVKLYKNIDNLINENFIDNKFSLSTLLTLMDLDEEQLQKINKNYNLLYKNINKLTKYKILQNITNRINNEALMEINRKYYFDNNLQLIELFS